MVQREAVPPNNWHSVNHVQRLNRKLAPWAAFERSAGMQKQSTVKRQRGRAGREGPSTCTKRYR
jgi:hypothetical protein